MAAVVTLRTLAHRHRLSCCSVTGDLDQAWATHWHASRPAATLPSPGRLLPPSPAAAVHPTVCCPANLYKTCAYMQYHTDQRCQQPGCTAHPYMAGWMGSIAAVRHNNVVQGQPAAQQRRRHFVRRLAECRREAKHRQGALLAVVLYAAASCTHRHTGTQARQSGRET